MKRILFVLWALLLTVTLVGCNAEKDKGKNKDAEKPQRGDKQD
jgi:hypothetical protein